MKLSNRCLKRAKELDESQKAGPTGLSSTLATYNVYDHIIIGGLPPIDELVLYLLFMRQYLITDHNK